MSRATHHRHYPPEVQAFFDIMRTADAVLDRIDPVLRPAGLSHQQYNVLRVLCGAGSSGLTCTEISKRMLTRAPDMTRLLDRLERRNLISRARETRDRRVVRTRITRAGLALLDRLDEPVLQAHRNALGHLGPRRLSRLIDLLVQARTKPGPGSASRTP